MPLGCLDLVVGCHNLLFFDASVKYAVVSEETKSASHDYVIDFKFVNYLYNNVDSLPNKMHELQIQPTHLSSHRRKTKGIN